jgi:hypothetical protein
MSVLLVVVFKLGFYSFHFNILIIFISNLLTSSILFKYLVTFNNTISDNISNIIAIFYSKFTLYWVKFKYLSYFINSECFILYLVISNIVFLKLVLFFTIFTLSILTKSDSFNFRILSSRNSMEVKYYMNYIKINNEISRVIR